MRFTAAIAGCLVAALAASGCGHVCRQDPCGDTVSFRFLRARWEPGAWTFAIQADGAAPFTCRVTLVATDRDASGPCAVYRPEGTDGPSVLVGEFQGIRDIAVTVYHDGDTVQTLRRHLVYTSEDEDGCTVCLETPVVVSL